MPKVRCICCGDEVWPVFMASDGICQDCAKKRFRRPSSSQHTASSPVFKSSEDRTSSIGRATYFLYSFITILVLFLLSLFARHPELGEYITSSFIPTPSPTAVPTPTAPPDDRESWITYYASKGTARRVNLDAVIYTTHDYGDSVSLSFSFQPMFDTKDYISAASSTIIDIGTEIRERGLVNECAYIHFSFSGGLRDQYGNKSNKCGITVTYTADEFSRMNFDYFKSIHSIDPDAAIVAADEHYIHPAFYRD